MTAITRSLWYGGVVAMRSLLPNYFGHSFLIIPTRLRVLMVKTFLIANAHTVCRSHMVHVRAQSDKDSDLGKLP